MKLPTLYDCQTCAACCLVFDEGADIEDADLIPEEMITVGGRLGLVMKTDSCRCCALEQKDDMYYCSIYENRPMDCRQFIPGSSGCIEARKQVNL